MSFDSYTVPVDRQGNLPFKLFDRDLNFKRLQEKNLSFLICYAEKDDLLIVISGSGNSPNVVKACEYAGEIGMKTAALTGRDGGKLKSLCDLSVIAPVEGMEQIEDIHMLWEHCIICTLRNVIDKEV